jgi:nitrite reductase (NO-forming)
MQPLTTRRLFALWLILVLVVPILAGCAGQSVPAGAGGVGVALPQMEAPAAAPSAVLATIEVRAVDLAFEPMTIQVPEPGRYLIRLVNDGNLPHDIVFDDGTRIIANPGATAEGEVVFPEGGTGFICSIAGHKDAGMVGKVIVGDAAPAAHAAHDDGHGGPLDTPIEPDPNAPPYELYPAAAPGLSTGTLHEIELVTEEKLMTVAPGIQQRVWTFGGTVPGPVLRVKVGDTVRITLTNPADSELPHSVDFHASRVAWNDEMTDIMPGESKVYAFKAEYAGVWMYHCGTGPALHHIANGMYGVIIVEPAEGLAPVDKEFVLVQSEWYLGPQGEVSSLAKAAAAAPAPDLVVFNGIANQYKDNPLQVEVDERVRVYVLNAGPSVDSAFHVVGTVFDTVIKEGVALNRVNPGRWGSQAVDLAPSQGAIVEFSFAEEGLYPIVTHAFNLVGRGALGLFQAGDGDPKN